MKIMRIIYGAAAVFWAAELIGYWAGYHTPDPVEISVGMAAVIVMMASGAADSK